MVINTFEPLALVCKWHRNHKSCLTVNFNIQVPITTEVLSSQRERERKRERNCTKMPSDKLEGTQSSIKPITCRISQTPEIKLRKSGDVYHYKAILRLFWALLGPPEHFKDWLKYLNAFRQKWRDHYDQ